MKLPESGGEESAKGTKALTGKEWNEVIDYAQRMTPRGDGQTTTARVTKDGTEIIAIEDPNGDPGGASFSDLPEKAQHEGHALLSGGSWNKLLDYLASITPKKDGRQIPDSDGPAITFPPIDDDIGTCTGDFSFEVTVTGGDYPFEWLGRTWDSSGQTRLVCGGGTQAQGQTTFGSGYYGYQNWEDTATGTPTGTLKFNNSYYDGIFPFTPSFSDEDVTVKAKKSGSFSMLVRWERNAITGSTYYGSPSYYNTTFTVENTSNLNAFSPAANALIDPADYKLFSAMNGSLTTTAGRTVAWTASPSFPWDYP